MPIKGRGKRPAQNKGHGEVPTLRKTSEYLEASPEALYDLVRKRKVSAFKVAAPGVSATPVFGSGWRGRSG